MKSRLLPTARLSFPLASAIAALVTASSTQAASVYWDGTSASWNTNTNWSTASGADTPDPVAVPGAADDAIFNITTVNGAETITLDVNQAVNSMLFNNTGTTALTGGGTARTLSLGTGGITVDTGAGAVTLGSGVATNDVLLNLSGAQTWTNNTASPFTISNTAATFTRQTGATLTLNQASTGNFAISTTVAPLVNTIIGPWAFFGTGASQRYAVSGATVTGKTGTGTITTTVNNMGSATTNYEYSNLSSTAGQTGNTANTIRNSAAANNSISLYNSSTANSYDLTVNGILAVGTGTFTISRSSAGAADAGLVIGATGELVIAGSQLVTISAPIQEGPAASRLIYSGSSTLTLSGVNTHTGSTTVSSGILRLSSSLALQSSPLNTTGSIAGNSTNGLKTTLTALTLGGLTGNKDLASLFTTTAGGYSGVTALTLNPGTGASRSYSGVIANGAAGMTLTKSGAGTQILSSANLYTGTTTISAGTLQLGAAGTTGTLDTGSSIVNNGILAINRTNAVVQGTDFSGAAITGTGGFTQAGSGTTTLNAANTFAGTTTVSAGKIIMTNPLALQNSAYNTTGSNGTTIGLDVTSGLSSGTLTLGGLSGAVDLASAFTAGYTGSVSNLTLNPQTGKTNIYSGIIADSTPGMALTKTGAGTQSLEGVNTYTGATTISVGMLILNNATALGTTPGVNGTSSISMAAGTTLRSNYIIVDAGNVNSFVYAPITLSGTGSSTFQIGAGDGSGTPEAVTFNLNGAIGGTAGTNVVLSTTSSDLGNTDSTFVLGAASTYDGNTTISVGNTNDRINVKAGVANALPSTTVLTFGNIAGSGTGRITQYDLNGNNQTLAGLSNGGNVPQLRNHRVTNLNLGALATLTINNSADFTFGGAYLNTANSATARAQIMGNIALVKSGAGTFTLGGALTNGATAPSNTYTGTTTIAGGTLALGTSNVLPSTAVSIGNGTLAVGAGFTDTVGTLDCTGAAVINLGNNNSKLVFADSNLIGGTGVWAGTLNITGTFVSGSSIKFATTGGLTPTQLASITATGFSGFALDASGFLTATSTGGYSAWQAAQNGGAGTTQTIDQDHDNDGVSNGVEYFLGGNTDTTGFTALPGVTNTLGTLSVTWTKAAGYTGTYGTGFVVETSATLANPWTNQSATPTPGFTVTFPTANEVKYTFPAGTTNFARLKVTGP